MAESWNQSGSNVLKCADIKYIRVRGLTGFRSGEVCWVRKRKENRILLRFLPRAAAGGRGGQRIVD